MELETIALSATAVATSIAVAVKQILDVRELKRWICFKNPCSERDNNDPSKT